ncbi:MAG: hypothetical protein Q8P35_02380 [Candidatus Yanofskybacteria bacterium]|nr:hypothetical protein [Candidatus Yanofskybacteria bacterium]
MAWAQEMKSLVSDIKTSTKDRLQFVKDNQQDTADLLSRFDKELKEMAADLKAFLSKSEKDRMADFSKMMKDIQARVKSIFGDTGELLARFDKELKEMAKDLKDFLAKSEQSRMADFKVMMKDIQSRIEGIQKHVADLLGDYAGERKEARANWGVLRKRERAITEEKAEEAEKEVKKAKKHKAE